MIDDDMQLVVFRLGSRELAFEILQVERILRYEPPAPRPGLPDFADGALVHEGDIVPVLDLRKRFGVPTSVGEETRLMVLDLPDARLAVVVDAAREVLRVDSTTIDPPGEGSEVGGSTGCIVGLVARGGRSIAVLNSRTLLTTAERQALRRATQPTTSTEAP